MIKDSPEIKYAPGMRLIIRDEEWMIKKIDTNEIGEQALNCIGISPLVKDKEAIFLTDLEEIEAVNPTKVKLVKDESPKYTKSLLYLESQWRQKNPTDKNIHIGHRAAMDLMPFQLEPTKISLNLYLKFTKHCRYIYLIEVLYYLLDFIAQSWGKVKQNIIIVVVTSSNVH